MFFRLKKKRYTVCPIQWTWKLPENNSLYTEPCHCLVGMFTTALNGWWRGTRTPLCHHGCTSIQTHLPQERLGWDKWSALTSWSSPTMNWMTKAMWVDGLPHVPPWRGGSPDLYPVWPKGMNFSLKFVDQRVSNLCKIKVVFTTERMTVARRVSYETRDRLKLDTAFVLKS